MKQIETATGVASIWKRTAQIGIIFFTLLMFFCGPPRPDTPPGLESDQPEVPPYEELAPRLKSENWSTRSETLLEIERGDYRQAIPEMLRLLRSDPHPAVRQTAALILGSFKVQEAAPIIARMLASDKEVSPDYLMEALARLEATG
ncbi:MAG: HEAT repeat domain-containing protein, partial [Leptospiraceae bacterium]|nr:HEAT repeat domain-containing protein [Leptospiraceae bacterium]